MTTSDYKLYHRDGKPLVIDVKDLPKIPALCLKTRSADNRYKLSTELINGLCNNTVCNCMASVIEFNQQLSTALSTKGIELKDAKVTMARHGIRLEIKGCVPLDCDAYENELVPIPEGFEVKIDYKEQSEEKEWASFVHGRFPKVATLLPIAQPKEESQEELWLEAEEIIEAELKDVRGYGPVTAQSISYFLRKVLKSKFHITRK